MSIQDTISQIRNYIKQYQKEHDKDFQCLPIDNHASLTLNNKNETLKFIFSNINIMNDCERDMSQIIPNIWDIYHMVRQNELNYEYFLIKDEENV